MPLTSKYILTYYELGNPEIKMVTIADKDFHWEHKQDLFCLAG